MKKKIFYCLLIVAIIVAAATVYLNRIVLPTKIKTLIITVLKERTGREVRLESLQFNIFKGLVFKNLTILEAGEEIVNIRSGSCSFLIWPFFRKQIFIPSLRLDSASFLVQRRVDNTINLADLFLVAPEESAQKREFSLVISKIRITNTVINFQDRAISPPYNNKLDNVDISLYLSLPQSAKFSFSARMAKKPAALIKGEGRFHFLSQELTVRLSLKEMPAQDIAPYLKESGFDFSGGNIDISSQINLKKGVWGAQVSAALKEVLFSQGKIGGKVSTDIKANLEYIPDTARLGYSGKGLISDLELSGLESVDTVSQIKGDIDFNNSGLSAEKLTGVCLSLPLEMKVKLTDFSKPSLELTIGCRPDLEQATRILGDRFKIAVPAKITGKGDLVLLVRLDLISGAQAEINGKLDIQEAAVQASYLKSPLEALSGIIEFSQNQLKWKDLKFRYLDTNYASEGVLTNFQSPGIQLELSSQDLLAQALLAVKNKLIMVSKCSGHYLNSQFSLSGNFDITTPEKINAMVTAKSEVDLRDLKNVFKKSREQLDKINPSGTVQLQAELKGILQDFKSCAIKAKLSSPQLSAYGLDSQNFLLDYSQEGGIINIPFLHLVFYDGSLDGNLRMNLNSQSVPFTFDLNVQGVKIEKLKQDTAAKTQDISGTLRAQAKVNGFLNDLSRASGAGQIFISNGKLWELNLFKGLGALLFTSDFTQVVFSEGFCGFIIKDKNFFSDNLRLKSNLADLSGVAKIGFDGKIEAKLDVQVSDTAPLTGTFRDVTTAVIGQAQRFGVITVGGTLADPKYSFTTSILDIIKGIKDTFLTP